MKKRSWALLVLAIGLVALWWGISNIVLVHENMVESALKVGVAANQRRMDRQVNNQSAMPTNQQGVAVSTPKTGQRKRWTIFDLEKLGGVPPGSPIEVWKLAEKTSWWGKRLDPKKFWKDRPIWYDLSAEYEARQHGRSYPPIPLGMADSRILRRSDEDTKADGFSVSGSQPCYVSSEREEVFWSQFGFTHPRPPSNIDREQMRLGERFLQGKFRIDSNDPIYMKAGIIKKDIVESLRNDANRLSREFGYPEEAFGENEVMWNFVMDKRREYQDQLDRGETPEKAYSQVRDAMYVDKKYITEPLTEADMKAANAWKVKYLRRLRVEKQDELYISAYLQAWNLSSSEVFSVSP